MLLLHISMSVWLAVHWLTHLLLGIWASNSPLAF